MKIMHKTYSKPKAKVNRDKNLARPSFELKFDGFCVCLFLHFNIYHSRCFSILILFDFKN